MYVSLPLNQVLNFKYRTFIIQEERWFTALIPGLPSCMTQGEMIEENEYKQSLSKAIAKSTRKSD